MGSETMNPWETAALQYHYPDSHYHQQQSHGDHHQDYDYHTSSSDTAEIEDTTTEATETYQHYQQLSRSSWRTEEAYDSSGVIYPGLYSSSGIDVMSILMRVATRPTQSISLGPIDSNCALVLCDLHHPAFPIVYATDEVCRLTGYERGEILGRNCRFLQEEPGAGTTATTTSASTTTTSGKKRKDGAESKESGKRQKTSSSEGKSTTTSGKTRTEKSKGEAKTPKTHTEKVNAPANQAMKQAIRQHEEVQVEVLNYRKTGEAFVNVISLVPIAWEDGGGMFGQMGHQKDGSKKGSAGKGGKNGGKGKFRYMVGFMGGRDGVF